MTWTVSKVPDSTRSLTLRSMSTFLAPRGMLLRILASEVLLTCEASPSGSAESLPGALEQAETTASTMAAPTRERRVRGDRQDIGGLHNWGYFGAE